MLSGCIQPKDRILVRQNSWGTVDFFVDNPSSSIIAYPFKNKIKELWVEELTNKDRFMWTIKTASGDIEASPPIITYGVVPSGFVQISTPPPPLVVGVIYCVKSQGVRKGATYFKYQGPNEYGMTFLSQGDYNATIPDEFILDRKGCSSQHKRIPREIPAEDLIFSPKTDPAKN
jgi:hypothetical protein